MRCARSWNARASRDVTRRAHRHHKSRRTNTVRTRQARGFRAVVITTNVRRSNTTCAGVPRRRHQCTYEARTRQAGVPRCRDHNVRTKVEHGRRRHAALPSSQCTYGVRTSRAYGGVAQVRTVFVRARTVADASAVRRRRRRTALASATVRARTNTVRTCATPPYARLVRTPYVHCDDGSAACRRLPCSTFVRTL